ncbi:cupin domain-containing protein [uncultured Methylobacterium sp.]|uniref:cupin domain-containing protein n=1 Tax=uncultured Methylobacterium sp. TaxID=157278 RepID=UPI0035CAF6D0
MEIARLLHTFGGPMLAFLSSVPALRRPAAPPPPLLDGPAKKNTDFPAVQPSAAIYWPEKSHILSGRPRQTATYVYESPDKLFAAGIWTCEPGKFRIDFGRDEFIHLLEGVVTVTDAEGFSKTYRAGDAFVTPAGFSGTWEVVEAVKKHFTYYGAID